MIKRVALFSLLVANAAAFLLPLHRPVARPQASRLFSTLEEKDAEVGDVAGTWETGKAYEVAPGDWFIQDTRVEDYSAMTEEEKANLPDVDSIRRDANYQPFVPTTHPFAWARNLHVALRAKDADRTGKFYEDVLGMKLLRTKTEGGSHSVTVGFGSEEFGQFPSLHFVTDGTSFSKGDDYLGATVVVDDVASAVSKAKVSGGKVVQEATGTAIIEDPNGYLLTLFEGPSEDRLAAVAIRVSDQSRAVSFYNKLGMKVLQEGPSGAGTATWVGYDDDHVYVMGFVHEKIKDPNFHMFRTPAFALELRTDGGAVQHGNGLIGIGVGVSEAPAAAAHARSSGAKVVKEDAAVSTVEDADGYKLHLLTLESFHEELV